jgi:hypothetical protein
MFYITLARVIDILAVCATAFLFVLFTLKQGFLNARSPLTQCVQSLSCDADGDGRGVSV